MCNYIFAMLLILVGYAAGIGSGFLFSVVFFSEKQGET